MKLVTFIEIINCLLNFTGPVQKYQEGEVNIHYRTPVRLEEKTWIPEHQLRMQQETVLRKIYQEERQKKYLQELRDLEMRRHQDFVRYLDYPLSMLM